MDKIYGYIAFIVITLMAAFYNLVFPSEAAVTTAIVEEVEYGDVYSTSSGDADAEISEITQSDISLEFDELEVVIILLVGIVLGVVLGMLVVGLWSN